MTGKLPNFITKRSLEEAIEAAAEENAPIATSPARAAEIACLKDFGLLEFIELTGIEAGDYGIFRITPAGVTLRGSEDTANQDLVPKVQVALLRAGEKLSLPFPCSPEQFMEWYGATRAENGVSDFPLAPGFLKALMGTHEFANAHSGAPIPSAKIVKAFKVRDGDRENEEWWDVRMRAAKRYKLLAARASDGRGGRPSQWYPLQVAVWLIDKNHLTRATVLRSVEQHFPEVDTNLL